MIIRTCEDHGTNITISYIRCSNEECPLCLAEQKIYELEQKIESMEYDLLNEEAE